MLLSVLQANAVVMDIEANLDAIGLAAERAASAGSDLLLTPELFPTGYAPLRLLTEFDQAALPAIRERLAQTARAHGIGLVYSLPAPADDGGWNISAVLLDGQGESLLEYKKVHLFGDEERKAFSAAKAAPDVVRFNGVNISLLICYDVEFPESVRAAAARGAELVLVPTALSKGFDSVPQVLIRARALESQVNVAYANHSGHEDGCDFLGGSVVAGPDGALLSAAGETPALLFAEISTEAVRAARQQVPYLRERRPGLYREWENLPE
ncbi:carbon-nitrogen hydrolase family protein [bacterium RCC_150]